MNKLEKPTRTTRRGEALGRSRGMPTAASRSVTDSGSNRTPVATAESPRATEKEGHDEEEARLEEELEEEGGQARLQRRVPQHAGVDQDRSSPPQLPVLPQHEQPEHSCAAQEEPQHRRGTEPLRRPFFRLHDTPRSRPDDPVDDGAEAQGGKEGPDQVEADTAFGRRVGHPQAERQDPDHDDDFAGKDPAPAGVGGEEAADERTDSDSDGTGGGDQAIGPWPLARAEVRRHQRDDGRHDQHRAEPFEEGPAEQQHPERARDRGRERPTAVDHAADHEGPLAAQDLTDLAARDHEGSHHQCVHGDGQLNSGHGGPDVLGHRRDRDVHDRRVQRHQELGGRQGEEDQSAAGVPGLVDARCVHVRILVDGVHVSGDSDLAAVRRVGSSSAGRDAGI